MSKAPGKRTLKPAAGPADPAAALRAMQTKLSSLAEPGAFSVFLKRIRHRTSTGSGDAEQLSLPLNSHEDPEAARFLHRLGVISNPHARKRACGEVEGFLESASRAGGPAPAVASVLVRAYASGLYGVTAEPVCGDEPRCGECPLSGNCREFNSPGSAAPSYAPGERPSERIETEGARALSVSEAVPLSSTITTSRAAPRAETSLGPADARTRHAAAAAPRRSARSSDGLRARSSIPRAFTRRQMTRLATARLFQRC